MRGEEAEFGQQYTKASFFRRNSAWLWCLPSREDAGLEGLAHLDALNVGLGQGRRVGRGVIDENLDGQSLNFVSLTLRNAFQCLEL